MIQTIIQNEEELDRIRVEILGLVQRNAERQKEYRDMPQTVRRQLARGYAERIADRTRQIVLLAKSTAAAAKQLCLMEAETPQEPFEPVETWREYLERRCGHAK